MANYGYSDSKERLDCEGGPTGTQRHRPSDPTGEPFARTPKTTLRAETRAGQFRRGGWDKYEVPSNSEGPETDLVEFFARGGNADTHLSADYPGGTVA